MGAFMMIGTPTASSLWPTYLLTVFSVVAGFAVYDILYRRVPSALCLFMPFAALAPLLKVCFIGDCGQLWPAVAEALAGALLGFCIPLAAAMATGGTGLGGGDIKFCGILGLIYGPSGDGSGFLCGRSLCHADGPSVPKALPAPPAHRHPVLTFSCLRLLDCNAG